MCDENRKLIPVITRAFGSISKSFRKYLSKTPGKQDIQDLQKTVPLSTARLLREILI
jgi:hypothetical protein